MSQKQDLTRRDFLKAGAKTGAGLAALGGISFFTHPASSVFTARVSRMSRNTTS